MRRDLYRNVAVESHTPAPRLCAQEIYSTFLLQLVSSITRIKGGAIRRSLLRGDHPDTSRWQHPAFAQLATILVDSGLVVDEEEAYMLVIPAFHAYGLLPKQLGGDGVSVYDSQRGPHVDK
jgi:hypothetical protein